MTNDTQIYEYKVSNINNSEYVSDWDLNQHAEQGWTLKEAVEYRNVYNGDVVVGLTLIFERKFIYD